MIRRLFYEIKEKDNGKTVGSYLKETGFSHRMIVNLKKTPYSILRNDIWLYVNDVLHTGDTLCVVLKEESSEHIVPVNLPLSIIFEDEDILVVNKPAGMPVHPSMDHYENTLANAAAWYFKEQGCSCPFRCVNRLDRDTTGLTLLAKHALSSCILSSDIRNRCIQREYLAIAAGMTEPAGVIDAPIARKDASVIEREVNFSYGERAVTHYKRLDYRDGLSLLSIHLETGRTHQIRVHMKHIGHPLVGDFLYNPDYTKMSRQSLHSAKLSFTHPITKEPMCFLAPLPSDMQRLFPDFRWGIS